MTQVRFLRSSALEQLRETVPENLAAYRTSGFPHLIVDHALYFDGKAEVETNALTALQSPTDGNLHDPENSWAVYRAIRGLTPYDARDERLWVYITHTYLLEYARQRWPIPADDEVATAHIRTHFFAKDHRQIERGNAGSRLWWMAHLCDRVKGMDLRTSLDVFLYRSDVRASIIERPSISQNITIFSAVLRKLAYSYKGRKSLFERSTFRGLMRELNSVGGAQLLDAMDEEQVTELIDLAVSKKIGLEATL